MVKKKDPLKVTFHNPNDSNKMVDYLIKIMAEELANDISLKATASNYSKVKLKS